MSTLAASLLTAGGMPSATAGTQTSTSPAQSDPVVKPTPFPRPTDPDADLRAGIAEAKKQSKPVEVTAATSETSRTWAYPDGHLTTESYSSPAQVKQPDGTWAWMDTALVEKDGVLKPRVAKADVQFSLGGDAPFATMERDKGQKFSLSWGRTLPRPVVKGNVATYVNAAGPSADLVVTALSTGFSHDVVLRERPTGSVEFRIPVQTAGMAFGESANGGLQLTDAKGKVIARAPRPVMWDAVGEQQQAGPTARRMGAITTSVARESGRKILILKPDAAWLADPKTRYPVTVDPTTTLSVISDTTMGSRSECGIFDQPSATLLKVGGNIFTCSGKDGFQYFRSYLAFDTGALAGKAIYSAALQLWRTDAFRCASTGDGKVRAARTSSGWTAGHMTWSNKPGTESDSVATICPTTGVSTPGAMSWPVTDWVKKWASGTPNYGIELQGPSESLTAGVESYMVTYHSAEMSGTGATPPKLIVQYFLPPEIPTVTAESVDSMDGDHAIVRTSSVKVGYRSTSVDGRNLDYYLSVLDSTAPLPAWTTGGGAAAQWSFTEGADQADSTGNGHSLTFVSGRYTNITGKDGKGIQFNGAPTVPSDGSTGAVLHTDKSFSVSGWVRADTTAGGGLFGQRTSAGDGFLVTYNGSARNFSMTMSNTATGGGTTITSSATVSSGTWAHLAAVYDATAHEMRLYVNGVQSAKKTFTSAWDSYGGGTFVINPSGGVLTAAKVSYDEVRAYQRALSETEIRWMLNLTPPTTANLPSGQTATQTYDVSNVDTFKISVRACLNGVTPITCNESPYYRITTDAPLLPTDTETGMADPVRPILSGMVNRPSGGTVTAKYYLYDSSGAPVGAAPLGTRTVNGGERASFQIPENTVQPGTAYKWQMATCAGGQTTAEEVCTAKTTSVSFVTPGTPPPPEPDENVRHLTLGKDNIVVKSAKTDATACGGAPCTVTDASTILIGGTDAQKTAAVVGFKLDELPDGAAVSQAILNLGTPICPVGTCPSDAVVTAIPLKSPVTAESRGSELAGDADTSTTPYTLPLTGPTADIADSTYQWLLLTSNKDEAITFGDSAATEQPSLGLTYFPAGPPSKVLNLVAAAGDASAIASWGLPESNGSMAMLDGYDVEVTDNGGSMVQTLDVKDPWAAVSGLSNGQTYTIRVRAKTAFGTGDWENITVTPKAVPTPPPSAGSACVPFLDTPPSAAQSKVSLRTAEGEGGQAFLNRVKAYYQAQDAVLEGSAVAVWDAPGVTPEAPSSAKLSLLNATLTKQRESMEQAGIIRAGSTVQLSSPVVEGALGGGVRVTAEVKRTWTETSGSAVAPAQSRVIAEAAGSVEHSESSISVFVFDRCGNITIIEVPVDSNEDSTDFIETDGEQYLTRAFDSSESAAAPSRSETRSMGDWPVCYPYKDWPGTSNTDKWRPNKGLLFETVGKSKWRKCVPYEDTTWNVNKFGAVASLYTDSKFRKSAAKKGSKEKYVLDNSSVNVKSAACFVVAGSSYQLTFQGAVVVGVPFAGVEVGGGVSITRSAGKDCSGEASLDGREGGSNASLAFRSALWSGVDSVIATCWQTGLSSCSVQKYQQQTTGTFIWAKQKGYVSSQSRSIRSAWRDQ
ncbi:LamG-like jellyroll fold domain-containing protein [Sphaerisporangium rhizosphaerae]|uniref:LamG-like jellyroll fold domain-containing protein n=1 Tax=Sphaerisporangium rhizosphaerae TaxID=2269375 RepID=A0ABW2PDQ5_9ACTN